MANEKLGVATEPSPESLLCIGELYICAVGLDILKLEQTSLFCRAWSFVSEGLNPPKSPPVATGLCGKTSACFLMQLTQKST